MELQGTRTIKLVLLGIVAAALLYVYYGTALLPVTHRARAAEIRGLEQRYQQLAQDLEQARQMASTLPEAEARHARLVGYWTYARRLLPEETEITALLHEIAYRGQQCGVEFTLFKPEPAVSHTFYSEKPVEIRVEGGYHQIARFLNELAQMDRIVHIQDLDIEEVADRPSDEAAPTARAHLYVSAYVLGAIAAPDAPNGAASAPSGGGLSGAVKQLVAGRQGTPAPAEAARGGAEGSEE